MGGWVCEPAVFVADNPGPHCKKADFLQIFNQKVYVSSQ